MVDRQGVSQDGKAGGAGGAGALKRQALYRAVNDQIEQLGNRWDLLDGPLAVLCECGNPLCVERIELAKPAYEAIRQRPARFVLKPGHETAGVDRIVERTDGYLVTEKSGVEAAAAARLDPRSPADADGN